LRILLELVLVAGFTQAIEVYGSSNTKRRKSLTVCRCSRGQRVEMAMPGGGRAKPPTAVELSSVALHVSEA
jgi:hypothetical protein